MKSSSVAVLGRILWSGCLLLYAPFFAQAQPKFIRLRNATITTEPPALVAGSRTKTAERPSSGLFLVQFNGSLAPEMRQQLPAAGLELLHYVPDDAFVVRGTNIVPSTLEQLPFVRWAGPFRPEYKIESALLPKVTGPLGEAQNVSILLAPDTAPTDLTALRRSLQHVSHLAQYRFGSILRGQVANPQLAALLSSDKVLWIEPAPKMQLFDAVSSRIVGGEGADLNTTAVMDLGYDGSGATVAVADSGLDSGDINNMHPDITGRVTALFEYGGLTDAADEHSHGTHVAGIIAGNGATGETDENGYLYGLGVAPGANLIAQRLFDGAGDYHAPPSYETLTRDATRAGADIGSNSWGDDTQGRYDTSAMEFDALVRDADALKLNDQPYILEFSAGNAGPFRQTVGSPAVAKNVIATGATENNRLNLPIEEFSIYSDGPDAMADFSSRGPCEDGRIKPDLVAPGTWIASLRSVYANDENAWWPISDNYMYQGGTSQAGPHVSGAAAVFVQYYRATHAGVTPSPALVKAALINSAADDDDALGTGPVPNMDEGWGRVDLPALIASTRDYDFLDQTTLLTNGQVFEQRVVVANSDEPLKITLAYTDVPGLPAAVPALVNDLDLEVISPDGHIYHGNQFQDGESVPDVPTFDTINNVEGVHLYTPPPGEYTIRVKGSRVVQDARSDTSAVDQDFALVVSATVAGPGIGIITFDRRVYRAPDLIKLKLLDHDLAGQPTANVLLRSTTESAGETITLRADGTTGLFTANVATVTGPPMADGQLQVSHGDRIDAVYQDASPAGARTYSAEADLQPPVISNVVATNEYGQILITWDSDEAADGIVRYGTNTLNFGVTNRFFEVGQDMRLTNVVLNVSYRFLIIAEDEAGNRTTNDNGGAYFTFSATKPPDILLVDAYSDPLFGAPPLSGYTDPLDQLGVSYEVFDATSGDEPSLAELQAHRCVIWRVPELALDGTISAPEVQALTDYLHGGGSLLIASMEVLSRLRDEGFPDFSTNELQVQSFTEDQPVNSITGASGDPVGAGIDLDLDYTPYEEIITYIGDLSDWIVPTTSATPVLYSGSAIVGVRSPKPGSDLPGRVVFLSFPLDAVPMGTGLGNNRVGLMHNILNFLVPAEGTSTIALDSDVYTVPARVTVEVEDQDLAGQSQTTVMFHSPRQTEDVPVTLLETARRGVFRGAISLVATSTGAPGTLLVQSGDTIRADYLDASPVQTLSAEATIETTPPVISGVTADPSYMEAIIDWDTSEPADALVQYSETRDSFPNNFVGYDATLDTSHEVYLSGLQLNRTYYYRVVSRDRAGNTSVDDNDGQFYVFTTLQPVTPPWTDDMENGPGDWQVQTDPEVASETEWTYGVPGGGSSAHSPTHAWGCNLEAQPISWAESFLISPAIDLTGGNHATLRFWHKADFATGTGVFSLEGGDVELYVSGSDSVVTLDTFMDYATDWEQLEYDLTPYAGKVVYLIWHYVMLSFDETDTTGWLIDDVNVTLDNVPPGTVEITNNLSQAVFALSGPVGKTGTGNWTVITNAPPGQYVVEFGDVPYYDTPAPQTNTLESSGVVLFNGNYTFQDANGNNLPDAWEQQYLGGAATNHSQFADSDNDGASDYAEFLAGTNPTNRLSVLKMAPPVPQSGSALTFRWEAAAGRSYRIAGSTDLKTWVPVSDWQRMNAGPASQEIAMPSSTEYQFYRLEVEP